MASLTLYPLTFVDEGDQVVIGRAETDSYGVFSADAAQVLRRLSDGQQPAAVAAWYEAHYGEPADIEDFVGMLRELGFIREDDADGPPAQSGPRWQRAGTVMFSRAALALYGAAIVAAAAVMAADPRLRPSPSGVYFTRSLLVVTAVTGAGQLAGVAWHEGWHVLAGRRLGLDSRLSIGRRLYFVVVQTTLSGLLGVPPRKRILPLCAGLLADALLVSALIAVAGLGPGWAGRAALSVAYVTLMRMLWQCMVFMETDLCHVLACVLRCPDLHAMTRSYLRSRLRGRQAGTERAAWSAREARIVRRFAPVVAQPDATADCDRRLRGPYTGTGTIIRSLVPVAAESHRRLVRRHAIEILAVAPELESITGPAPGTLTSLATGQERTRWYSRQRTRRIAHGLVEFLRALASVSEDGPLTLALEGLDDADPLAGYRANPDRVSGPGDAVPGAAADGDALGAGDAGVGTGVGLTGADGVQEGLGPGV